MHAAMTAALSTSVFSVLVFVEGQGQYVQPPSDNYNLTLDPFLAARFIFVNCSYEEDGVRISYKWTKDGAFFDPGGLPGRATVSVPNGDYSSSIEGIYSCTALVDGIPTNSRRTNVTLPGKWQGHVFTFHIPSVYCEETQTRASGGSHGWGGPQLCKQSINHSINYCIGSSIYLVVAVSML